MLLHISTKGVKSWCKNSITSKIRG